MMGFVENPNSPTPSPGATGVQVRNITGREVISKVETVRAIVRVRGKEEVIVETVPKTLHMHQAADCLLKRAMKKFKVSYDDVSFVRFVS